MNDREFRQHLVKLRLERERKEAQAANAVKKPPATAKSQKAKKSGRRRLTFVAVGIQLFTITPFHSHYRTLALATAECERCKRGNNGLPRLKRDRELQRRSLSVKPTSRPYLLLFHIETNGKKTLAVLDGTPHLSALEEIACVISRDDVRIEGMAASFTVPILVV